jgi:enamine deaminase RidA (YjgF/YER057c/UK114 family)
MSLPQRLQQLGLELPPLSGPFGAYVPAKRVGNLLFVAGQLPRKAGSLLATGPVPSACPVDQARQAARQCVLNALAAANAVLGSLDPLAGVVRVGAFVHSDPAFADQPKVADGASELLLELFGTPAGQHARAAVGTNALPANASVEIEFVFELR